MVVVFTEHGTLGGRHMNAQVRQLSFLFSVFVTVLLANPAWSAIWYVSANSPVPNGTCLSWDEACPTIGAALAKVSSGDEIRVAGSPGAGLTYFENVVLTKGVILLGGFPFGGTLRDPQVNVTIIDGGNLASTIAVPYLGVSSGFTVDGFTIQNGSAALGGGINVDGGLWSGVISHNVFRSNSATGDGGAVYTTNFNGTIESNTFLDNSAVNLGGAIAMEFSPLVVQSNLFSGNSATEGGALYCWDRLGSGSGYRFAPRINNNRVLGNHASLRGGGINVGTYCNPVIHNNALRDNTAAEGGGLWMIGYYNSPCEVINNSFVQNSASISNGAAAVADCTVANNIVTFNAAPSYGGLSGGQSYSANCVYGNQNDSFIPPGSMQLDPRLDTADSFHIRSNSPCKNKGDNAYVGTGWVDIDGQVRIDSSKNIVDIGCDEWYR